MSLMRLLIIVILFCSLNHSTNSWRMFQFNFTSLETEYNPVCTRNAGATIRLNPQGHGVVDGYYQFKKKLKAPIFIHVQFLTITKDVRLPIRFNTTFDVCELFKKPKLPPVLSGIYKGITSHMDMPLKCPVEPEMYHMTGIGDNEEDYPPYLPLGNYRVNLRFHQLKKRQYIDLAKLKIVLILAKNNNKRTAKVPRKKN